MKKYCQIALASLLALTTSASADTVVHGTAGSDTSVSSATVINLRDAMTNVANMLDGQTLDARVIETDQVYYKILVKTSKGRLVSVLLDAHSGKQVPTKSTAQKDLLLVAAPPSETTSVTAALNDVLVNAETTASYANAPGPRRIDGKGKD